MQVHQMAPRSKVHSQCMIRHSIGIAIRAIDNFDAPRLGQFYINTVCTHGDGHNELKIWRFANIESRALHGRDVHADNSGISDCILDSFGGLELSGDVDELVGVWRK